MNELIFLIASLALLGAFLALTEWETARGLRVAAPLRERFDEHVARAGYVARNVDWGAYLAEHLRAFALWIGHEIARETLRFVRFVERSLSKIVRQLRQRAASEAAPAEPTRPFVQALSDFKEELKESRPDNIDAPPV